MRVEEIKNLISLTRAIAIKKPKVHSRKGILLQIIFIIMLLYGCNIDKITNDDSIHKQDAESNIERLNETNVSKLEEESPIIDEEGTQLTNELVIYGKWRLEKIVLKSENFDEISPEAYDNFDYNSYVGHILEYNQEFVKVAENSYLSPSYELEMTNISDYSDGGIFKSPNLADLILSEEIYVSDSENYEWLSEVPIKQYKINLNDKEFNPLVSSVLVLNDNTILVGTGGKIILATRIR